MDHPTCGRCAQLQAENAALRAENERLRNYIAFLLAKLQRIAEYTRRVVAQSEQVMATGNQPRGRWSFVKGGHTIAQRIRRLL